MTWHERGRNHSGHPDAAQHRDRLDQPAPAMTRRLDFSETTTNMVAGLVIGFIILMMIGTPAPLAAAAQGSFVVVSFIRTYLIRRLFRWIGERYD